MILLNFSHPLTADHLAQVEALTGQAVQRVIERPLQVSADRRLAEQVVEVVDRIGPSVTELQTLPLVVNPPGYAPAAAALLAELHGRIGYFPAILWIRPVVGSTPPRFQVAEVVNLQAMREAARERR